MWLSYLVDIIIFASLAVSLNLLVGYAGQLSVAHAGFAAIGGYSVGYLTEMAKWEFLPALLVGVVISGVLGLLLGLPALRLSMEYLILLTLGFNLVVVGIASSVTELGGSQGLTAIKDLSIFGLQLDSPVSWLVPSLVLLVVVFSLSWRTGQSPLGRVLKGIREDSLVTQSLGKNVFWFKVGVFGLTAAFSGAAGGMLSGWLGIVTPGLFSFNFAMTIFAMVVIGGTGRLVGSILGAIVLTVIAPILRDVVALQPSVASQVQLVVYGVGLVVVMAFRPQGLMPRPRRAKVQQEALPDELPEALLEVAVEHSSHVTRTEDAPVVLRAQGVTKRFGGIAAVEDLNIELRKGRITALVGPNGAGKTTVFNLLTGAITPDSGQVFLGNKDLTGHTPDYAARHGVVRTFQDVRLLQQLSCLENVMLGVQHQAGENFLKLFIPSKVVSNQEAKTRATAMKWLDFVGMADSADVPAHSLSYGQSKLISLARALATEAPVLLLDEPASGVDPRWVDVMMSLVERVRDEGRTVCIVEHNLSVVSRLADYTYFMQLGKVTAEGSISELMKSAELSEAYFGSA